MVQNRSGLKVIVWSITLYEGGEWRWNQTLKSKNQHLFAGSTVVRQSYLPLCMNMIKKSSYCTVCWFVMKTLRSETEMNENQCANIKNNKKYNSWDILTKIGCTVLTCIKTLYFTILPFLLLYSCHTLFHIRRLTHINANWIQQNTVILCGEGKPKAELSTHLSVIMKLL